MANKKAKRKERRPFGSMRQKLQLDKPIPGYRTYWFNDIDTRIIEAEEAGYEFVYQHEIERVGEADVTPDQLDQGKKVTKVVGTTETGAPQVAFLMKIRQEWYEEDKAEKARKLSDMEQALKQPNVENLYHPTDVPGGIRRS